MGVPEAGHRRAHRAVRSPLSDLVTGQQQDALESPARGSRIHRLRARGRRRLFRLRSSLGGNAAAVLRDIAILDKAMLLTAVSFVAFVPLLLVLAAVSPIPRCTRSPAPADGDRAHDDAARSVAELFAPPNRSRPGQPSVGLLVLATTAVAFVGTLQQNYELILSMPRCPRMQRWWRHPVSLTCSCPSASSWQSSRSASRAVRTRRRGRRCRSHRDGDLLHGASSSC